MEMISLSSAIEGYLLNASARRLSPRTIEFYTHIFNKFQRHLPTDPPISAITTTQVKQFLVSLTTLSNKSLLGYHAALSSLWRWAAKERLVEHNIIRDIDQPTPEIVAVNPFTEAEIRAILGAVDKSTPYSRPGKRTCQNSNPNAKRNRTIIYVLLDTGMRASELCGLRIRDIDLKTQKIVIQNGKGDKQRVVPFSANTGQALWRYLATRKDESVNSILFPSKSGRQLPARELYHILHKIGERAGVPDVHPHRFRHTFAIQFLRNHGDVYTLQDILGHSDLDMVRRYLRISMADIEAAHRQASPVANWRL